MPRVKLAPDHWEKTNRDRLCNAIRNSGKKKKDMAALLGITPSAFTYRMQHMAFSLEDFSKIAEAVGMEDKQILKIVRR